MYLILLLLLGFLVKGDESNFCTKFIVEQKEDTNFILVNVGTPLVPYRLLLCTNPYIKMMNFYNIILFSSSFGNGLAYNTQVDVDTTINNPGLSPKTGYTRKDYRSTISKSVTFSEIFTDEWTVVGHDYVRGIDGTWISAGIEIPNIQDGYSIFTAYCNPGGFSDTRAPEYEPKFDDIDGFFIIQPNLRLVYNQNINTGVSTFSIKDGVLSYCYTTSQVKNTLFTDTSNKILSGRLTNEENFKTSSLEELDVKSTRVKFSLRRGQIVYKKDTTLNSKNDKKLPMIYDTHMKATINANTLSSNYGIENQGLKSDVSVKQGKLNMDHASSYTSWVYSRDRSRLDIANMNPIDELKDNKQQQKRSGNDINKKSGEIHTTVFFNLDQPYTYISSDLYTMYTRTKNFIVDVPDDQWDDICIHFENRTVPTCIGGSNIVRQAFTTQRKSGSISYFPQPNVESNSVTDVASMAVTIYGTIHGGRFWGNTLVERNARSLKKTAFSRMKPNTMTAYHDDAYTKNSRHVFHKKNYPSEGVTIENTKFNKISHDNTKDNFVHRSSSDVYMGQWKNSFENNHIKKIYKHVHNVDNKRFQESEQELDVSEIPVRGMDLHTSYLFSNLYRLNILPHGGDLGTVYLGSTFLSKNSIGYALVVDHTSQDFLIDSSMPVAFEQSFLIQNTDIDTGDFIYYFVFHAIYIIMFINVLFTIKTTVNHQLLFDIFEMKYDGLLDTNSRRSKGDYVGNIKGTHLLTHMHKKIFVKDALIHTIEILTFLCLLIFFGWSGIVIIFTGFSDTMANLHIPAHTSTLKQVQITFSVSSILILATTLLTFGGIMYIAFGTLDKQTFSKIRKSLWGVNRTVVFENIYKAPHNSDVVTQMASVHKDIESDSTDNFATKKETIFRFLNSQKISINIISYIMFLFSHLIFITGCIYIISIASKTSSVLRFWNLVANIVILYVCLYALLFLTTILRVIPKHIPSYGIYRTKRDKDVKRLSTTPFWVLLVIMVLIAAMVITSIIGFVIPYELDTYQADYSKFPMNYVVSTVCVACIMAIVIEVWESNWKDAESLRFSVIALKTVAHFTQTKND